MLFDRLLAPLRRRYHKRGVGFGKSAPARTFKKFLGGLLIPIGLAAAASQVVLSTPLGATTGIAYLKTVSTRLSPSAPPTEIAELALRSQDAPTKILAIQALGSLRTPEALTQLVRIADTDPRALRDGGSRYALRQAIASYGETAIEPLLEFFRSLPAEDSLPGSLPDGVFERYFASGFAGLMEEARLSGVDEAGLAQIEASQAQLEASLAGLGMEQPAGGGADPQGRQDFVIQTLLAMDLREQADLLRFARATAADPAFSGQVRGDALLLLAQLGEQKDLDGLYAFLESEDPVLRMRALQAITAFQTRDDPGLEAGPQ
jgi:HEAT repeat protein